MTMAEKEEEAIEQFDTTVLVRINPEKTTLPIDTAAEWTKGFTLLNVLIKELADHRYIEEFMDDGGNLRSRPMLHPQLLGYLQERRKQIDQIFKIMGGEVANEVKKESAKKLASVLFDMQMDEIKQQYKGEAYNIIEVEASEDEQDPKNKP
jgi:hypothetical protein